MQRVGGRSTGRPASCTIDKQIRWHKRGPAVTLVMALAPDMLRSSPKKGLDPSRAVRECQQGQSASQPVPMQKVWHAQPPWLLAKEGCCWSLHSIACWAVSILSYPSQNTLRGIRWLDG